jgi:hypothetical protein
LIKPKTEFKIFFRNGRWCVTSGPVSPDPGRDKDPARSPGEPGGSPADGSPSGGSQPGTGGIPDDFPGGWREVPSSGEDWLTEEQWVAWLSSLEPEEPPAEDPEDDPGLDDPAQPGTARPRSYGAKGASAGNRARAGQGARAGNGARGGPRGEGKSPWSGAARFGAAGAG